MTQDSGSLAHTTMLRQPENHPIQLWPFALVIVAHMIGMFLPVTHAWGFNYWGLFSPVVSVGFLVLALIVLLPPIRRYVSDGLAITIDAFSHIAGHGNRYLIGGLVSILLFAAFFLFRVIAHVYGDGFTRLTGAASLTEPQVYGKLYVEGAAVLLGHYSIRLFDWLFGVSAEIGFAISSCIGGVIGVWALYAIAGSLAPDRRHRWFIMLGAFSSAAVILFFGYIESYTWATAVGLWSLYWAIKHARREAGWWPGILLSLVAAAFHMIALTYFAVAVYAMVIRAATERKMGLRRLGLFIGITAAAGSFALAAIVQFTSLPQVLVPLWPVERVPYWFLDPAHLLDIANTLIQVAPLGLVVVLILLINRRVSRQPDPTQLVLGGAALFTFLASFWIDPEIGAMRDWDLLSVYGFPVSLWAIYRLAQADLPGTTINGVPAAVAVLALITVVPNLIEKNDLHTAVARLDQNLFHDIHYQAEYKEAERCYPWGVVLRLEVHDIERPIKYFRRRLQAKDDAVDAYANLGELYVRRQEHDSAQFYLRRAVQIAPANTDLLSMLGTVEAGLGNTRDAAGHWRKVLELDPDAYRTAVLLGMLYYNVRQPDSAYAYLKRGITTGGYDSVKEKVLEAYCVSAAIVGKWDQADEVLKILERKSPGSPGVLRLRKMFDDSDTTRSRNK